MRKEAAANSQLQGVRVTFVQMRKEEVPWTEGKQTEWADCCCRKETHGSIAHMRARSRTHTTAETPNAIGCLFKKKWRLN